jgi:hypothetical protein
MTAKQNESFLQGLLQHLGPLSAADQTKVWNLYLANYVVTPAEAKKGEKKAGADDLKSISVIRHPKYRAHGMHVTLKSGGGWPLSYKRICKPQTEASLAATDNKHFKDAFWLAVS